MATMSSSAIVAPPNSLMLISDQSGGTPPDTMRGARLSATPSCIAVGCLMFADGRTKFTLGIARDVGTEEPPVFDGILETPQRTIVVRTVEHKTLLKSAVDDTRTRVRVWVNRPTEPDKVIIGVG